MKRIALFGISSPVAVELLRVLSIHPMIELVSVADDAFAGQRVAEVLPGLSVANRMPVIEVERALSDASDDFDLAIVAESPTYAAPIVAALAKAKRRWIEFAAPSDLKGRPPLQSANAIWGTSYRHEAQVSAATCVRMPSPSSQALNILLAPIARTGLLHGRLQAVSTFDANFGAGGSAHFRDILKSDAARETSQFLSGAESDFPFEINVVSQSVPSGRALLLTAFIELSERLTLSTLDNLYREYYDPALFVLQMNAPLDARQVVGSNRAHFFLRASGNQLVGTLVLDVLGRGSAMQAVECANLMLGLPEEAGLLFPGHG